jgi:hypothetical protein
VRIVAGFHTRNDEWILPLKLKTLSQFCDEIVVCLDRPQDQVWDIIRKYPKAKAFEHKNTLGHPDFNNEGPLCEEGRMRQETFDRAIAHNPDFVILGDTDEIVTPDTPSFLASALAQFPDVDVFKLPMINLYKGEDQYISGVNCIWSPEHKGSNKRGAIVRYRPEKKYVYEDKFRHVPCEPRISGPDGVLHILRTHHVQNPKMLHYKFANWERWEKSYKAGMEKYRRYWEGLETSSTLTKWFWRDY